MGLVGVGISFHAEVSVSQGKVFSLSLLRASLQHLCFKKTSVPIKVSSLLMVKGKGQDRGRSGA
jgi:hypothetical protein